MRGAPQRQFAVGFIGAIRLLENFLRNEGRLRKLRNIEPVVAGQGAIALRVAGRRTRKIDRYLDLRRVEMRGVEGDGRIKACEIAVERLAGLRTGEAEFAFGVIDSPDGGTGSESRMGSHQHRGGEPCAPFKFCHRDEVSFVLACRRPHGSIRVRISSRRIR